MADSANTGSESSRRRFGVPTKAGSPDTANLLGALVLGIEDAVLASIDDAAEGGAQVAAALVTLHTGPSFKVGDLAQVLGLSHAGAVRLVDRLERSGWVRRERGRDARSVLLSLTPEGARLRERIVERRMQVLAQLVARLQPDEKQALHRVADKLLQSLAVDPVRAYAVCRLCDTERCTPYGCPVEQGCCAALAAQGA